MTKCNYVVDLFEENGEEHLRVQGGYMENFLIQPVLGNKYLVERIAELLNRAYACGYDSAKHEIRRVLGVQKGIYND